MASLNMYVLRPTRQAYIEILGEIWMPPIACAMKRDFSDSDLNNINEFTRENVSKWLSTHSGDFSHVIDFHAVCGEQEINWGKEENELAYNDAMYGE